MAKDTTKKKKVTETSNNFDKEFEDFLDNDDLSGDFNEDPFLGTTKDDRKPVYETIGEEVIKSIKKEGSEVFLKRLAKKTLPIEYEEYLQEAISIVDFTKDIFEKSKEQLKRPISRFATEVKKVVPQNYTAINKVLDKLISEKEETPPSKEQLQETAIESALSSIFDKQIEVQKALEANRISREDIERKIELKALQKNSYYLSAIQAATETQTSFTLNIAKEYYKKSLELQFRSYYVQSELLRITKDYFKGFSLQFDNITKNTSLPDALKIKNNERLIEEIKKRATTGIYARLIGDNEYFNKVKENIAKMVQYKINDLLFMADSLNTNIGSLSDLSDIGPSKQEIAGSFIGSQLTQSGSKKLADILSPKLKDKVMKNEYVQKGAKFLSALGTSPQTFLQSIPGILNQVKERTESKPGVFNSIVSALAGKAEEFASVFNINVNDVKRKFKQDITTLKEPAIFNQLYHRSVTQVIPLYLAHILRENTIQSKALLARLSGKERINIVDNTPILSYDFNQNKLVSTTELATNYTKYVKSKLGLQTTKSSAERIVSAINLGGGKINPIEREAFIKSVEKLNEANFDLSKLDFDNIREGSQLEQEIKSILGEEYINFKVVVDRYRKIKDEDKKDKTRKMIKETIKNMGDNKHIEIVRKFLIKLFNLPVIKKGIKGYIIKFTDKELESIAYSILKSLLIKPNSSILPIKRSIMSYLGYLKPLDNEKENEEFKKKLSIWINVNDVTYNSANLADKMSMIHVYGELSKELRKIAQIVSVPFIESVFEANPVLDIDPDKDMPDWGIIFNGDFIRALYSDDKDNLDTTDLFNSIDSESIKEYIVSLTRKEMFSKVEESEGYIEKLKKRVSILKSTDISSVSGIFKETEEKLGKIPEDIKKIRERLGTSIEPQEFTSIYQNTLNNVIQVFIEVSKSTISAIKSKLNLLVKTLENNLSDAKVKEVAINAIDAIIFQIDKEIKESKKNITELQDAIREINYSQFISDSDSYRNKSIYSIYIDEYAQLEINYCKVQIEMNEKGIEVLKKVIIELIKIKEIILSITENTEESKLIELLNVIRSIYDGMTEKLKSIESIYEKKLGEIEKAKQELDNRR